MATPSIIVPAPYFKTVAFTHVKAPTTSTITPGRTLTIFVNVNTACTFEFQLTVHALIDQNGDTEYLF